MGTGQANVKAYNRQLRDLIHVGKAKPSFIVLHNLPLNEGKKWRISFYDSYERRRCQEKL